MDIVSDKQYVDACVQTSPVICATRISNLQDIPLVTLQEDLKTTTNAQEECIVKEITRNISNASPQLVAGLPQTPLKAIKSSLPHARPSQLSGLILQKSSQRRIVSLPEKLGVDTVQEEIARSILVGTRNVSMPAAYRHFATLDSGDIVGTVTSVGQDSSSFSADLEGDSRNQTSLRSLGLPETPSPPSSPETVEIIENSAHLPETFLHAKRKPAKDEVIEWQPWTTSPPRPIPALHGPASLPYARCPSGAEGTVLEEPSTVPGLIWGLAVEAGDAEGSRGQFPSISEEHGSHYRTVSERPSQKDSNKTSRAGMQTHDEVLDEFKRLQIQEMSRQFPHSQQDFSQQDLEKLQDPAQKAKYSDKWNEDDNSGLRRPGYTHRSTISTTRVNAHISPEEDRAAFQGGGFQSYDVVRHREIPSGVLESFLHGRQANRETSELNATAPTFVPTRTIHNVEAVPSQPPQTLIVEPKNSGLFQKQTPFPEALFPSSTDTSPLWSEPSPPLLNTPLLHNASTLPTSSLGLDFNQLLSPALSSHSAFDQLKQLALYQRNFELLSYLQQTLKNDGTPASQPITPVLFTRTRMAAASHAESSRPYMPINLPDLVASNTPILAQTPTFTPLIATTPVLPNTFLPATASLSQEANQNVNATPSVSASLLSSSDSPDALRTAVRDATLAGRRYPRSIPLARMLERRLASVPEETSGAADEGPSPLVMQGGKESATSADVEPSALNYSGLKNDGSVHSAMPLPDQKLGNVTKASAQGHKQTEKAPFKGKKLHTKAKTGAVTASRKSTNDSTSQENTEPQHDRSTTQKKRKNNQVKKTKAGPFKARHKED